MPTVKINENIDLAMRERAPSTLRTISVAMSTFLNPKLLLHKEREVAQSKIVFEKDLLPLESHFPKRDYCSGELPVNTIKKRLSKHNEQRQETSNEK